MVRPIARDHAEKRARILRISADLFATEGLARVSMARIAQACGVSKAAIYHYYPSKDALLFDILDNYLSSLRDRLLWLNLTDLPPDAALLACLRELCLAHENRAAVQKIMPEALRVLPAAQQKVLTSHCDAVSRRLRRVLVAAAPRTLGGRDERQAIVTEAVIAMVGALDTINPNVDRSRRYDHAALVAGLVLRGLPTL